MPSDKQDSNKTLLKSEIEGIVAEEAINLQKAPKLINRELSFAEEQKIDVLDAILQTTDRESRQKAIVRAAETLGKSPRTIKRMIARIQNEGVATLITGRKDKGHYRSISEQWYRFIFLPQEDPRFIGGVNCGQYLSSRRILSLNILL